MVLSLPHRLRVITSTQTLSAPIRASTARIRDLQLLKPVLRRKVQAIVAVAQAHGVPLEVYETYRSQARQTQLFNQGATQFKQVGTHHYGLSCDVVNKIGGEWSWKGDFSLLGRLAREHQLIWGGDWTGFPDHVHVQRCSLARQTALFRGEWYPSDSYDPYQN